MKEVRYNVLDNVICVKGRYDNIENNFYIDYRNNGDISYIARPIKYCYGKNIPCLITYYSEDFLNKSNNNIYSIKYVDKNNYFYKAVYFDSLIINYYYNGSLIGVSSEKDYEKYVKLQNIS